jgi:hypothetical protein
MSGIRTYQSLDSLAKRLRDDLNNPTKPTQLILLYAYNRTGKTRLAMEFKDEGKRKNNGISDTLYFNAFTEDLFTWDNDLDGDALRHLQLNPNSTFFNGLKDLALDETIAGYLDRYADFDFDIDYTNWKISFSKEILRPRPGAEPERVIETNIKISRGEQNIFIWCLFMAICERMLDGHISYQSKKYLYIDDPSPHWMTTTPSPWPATSPNSSDGPRAGQIRTAHPRPSRLSFPPITPFSST